MVFNRMKGVITARYAPLVLPQNLNAFPKGDYMKYLPDIMVREMLLLKNIW
jgi:hypothetical protein